MTYYFCVYSPLSTFLIKSNSDDSPIFSSFTRRPIMASNQAPVFLLPRWALATWGGQAQIGIAVWEAACHMNAAAYILVQPLNRIPGADTSPVIAKGNLNRSELPQCHSQRFGFQPRNYPALLSVDCLEHLDSQLYLRSRRD